MILAFVVFLSPAGPVGVNVERRFFHTVETCQNFAAAAAPALDVRRAQLERMSGQPVVYVTFCQDVGQAS